MKTRSKPNGEVNPLWLTVEEAAMRLGVSRSITYRLITTGDLPSFVVPTTRSRRVHAEVLQEVADRIANEQRVA